MAAPAGNMFFYRRGCFSFLVVSSMSFMLGNFFNQLFCNNHQSVQQQPFKVERMEPAINNIVTEQPSEMSAPAETIDKINIKSLKPSLQRKYVHFDLKGAPPKISYLLSLLPLLKENGVNGLLLEYEDTFPYEGEIYELSNTNPYTKEMLKTFLSTAVTMGFDIIPLVQTFGHMEFVLKLESFRKLRENSMYPNVICPSQKMSVQVIKQIIDQVVSFHKEFGIKRIHVGNDEVYHLAECDVCSNLAAGNPLGNVSLLLGHMQTVAKHVINNHHIIPIVWHDMLTHVSGRAIQMYDIPSLVEIMVWDYTPELRHSPSHDDWLKLQLLFKGKIWIASAFKGATGVAQKVTSPAYHLQNHKSWVKTLAKYGEDQAFHGIMLTGWQRYDHFSVMCELFPVAIPSLIVSLNYLNNPDQSDDELLSQATKNLRCTEPQFLEIPNSSTFINCDFPGSKLYKAVIELHNLEKEYTKILGGSHMVGWMTDFHSSNSYTNPDHVRLAMRGVRQVVQGYNTLTSQLQVELSNIYEPETIDEWLGLNFYVIKEELKKLEGRAEKLMAKMSWPRRYFKLNVQWYELRARKTLKLAVPKFVN